ncbi:hypothetical protein OAV85_02950 [Candidatus Nanopelagicales bacterium]|nr:hypothetical protein [Candidatus Nanopelagicales bacterium]
MNRTWVMDCTHVAFIVDAFAQKIVARHHTTSKEVNFVVTPPRVATWQHQREGHPVERDPVTAHAYAGSQYAFITITEHHHLQGIRPSISSVADSYGNELMAAVIRLFKSECIRTKVFHAKTY